MILVRISIHPPGKPERELACIEISNVTPKQAEVCDYAVDATDELGRMRATVLEHERRRGFWPLLARAMEALTALRGEP